MSAEHMLDFTNFSCNWIKIQFVGGSFIDMRRRDSDYWERKIFTLIPSLWNRLWGSFFTSRDVFYGSFLEFLHLTTSPSFIRKFSHKIPNRLKLHFHFLFHNIHFTLFLLYCNPFKQKKTACILNYISSTIFIHLHVL